MIQLVIRVKPGASRDEITVDKEGNISVRIKAKPVDGQANDYLVKYLADEFNISRAKIQIEKGAKGRMKRIAMNMSREELDGVLKKHNNT